MWDWVNWRPIFEQHFGTASNPVEAFLQNPADFSRHIWFNIRYFIFNGLVYFSETMFPKRVFGISSLIGIGLLLFAVEWKSSFKAADQFIIQLKSKSIKDFLPWLILTIPSILAGLIFQPRPHYILPLLPFFVLFLSLYLKRLGNPIPPAYRHVAGIGGLLFLLFFLPKPEAFFVNQDSKGKAGNGSTHPDESSHFSPVNSYGLPHKELAEKIKLADFPAGFRMFDASTGATEFAGSKLIQIGKTGFEMNYPALVDFRRFLDSADVQGIFLHETIRYDRFFSGNQYWNILRRQPEAEGWVKRKFSSKGDSLLLRKRYAGIRMPD